MSHIVTRDYDLSDAGVMLAADCEFIIDIEDYELEPFSWGGQRGTTHAVAVTMRTMRIGSLTLSREQAVQMLGADVVQRHEDAVQDEMLEDM